MKRVFPIFALTAIYVIGCAKQNDISHVKQEDIVHLQYRVTDLEQQIGRQRDIANNSINALRNENESLNTIILQLTDQLSAATSSLAKAELTLNKIKEKEYQRRLAFEEARRQEEQRKNEMLEQTRIANRPADYPFRIYDALYVGTQLRDGYKTTYGRFSIRNYTDQEMTGVAIAISSMNVSIPPNSVREGLFIRAHKDKPLTIRSNLGEKTVNWELR